MVFGERRLDRRLADGEPVEGGVELVLIDRTEAELLTEAGLAVSGDSARAAASLEPGSRRRLTTRARTRSRQRLPSGPSRRSRPILRAVPRAAATCPYGSERMMVIACWSLGMTVPPLSSILKPAMRSAGQSERLSRVRFLTLPPSR